MAKRGRPVKGENYASGYYARHRERICEARRTGQPMTPLPPRPTMAARVALRLDQTELDAVDQARGVVSRSEYVRAALRAILRLDGA